MALSEADMGVTQLAFDSGQQRDPGDDHLLVKFELVPKQNAEKSIEEGRPIFEELEYVHIMVPGQKDNVYFQPASQHDKDRFPRHYAAFKNREGEYVEGTPLSEWPGITRAQAMELESFHVKTVEQLSEMSDSHAQNFMGIRELQRRARVFLETSADNAAGEKLAAELSQRDTEIESLKLAVEEQGKLIEELRASDTVVDSDGDTKSSRGRGRAKS